MDKDLNFFVTLERQVWEALQAGDPAADAQLLAENFLGVYESGFGSKSDHVAQLSNGSVVAQFELEVPRLTRLNPVLALLTYRAHWTDHAGMVRGAYISSLWECGSDGWRNTFSQDTSIPIANRPSPRPRARNPRR